MKNALHRFFMITGLSISNCLKWLQPLPTYSSLADPQSECHKGLENRICSSAREFWRAWPGDMWHLFPQSILLSYRGLVKLLVCSPNSEHILPKIKSVNLATPDSKCEGHWRMTRRIRSDHCCVMRNSQNVLSNINEEVLLHQHLGALCSHYHGTHHGFFDYRDIIKPFWCLKSPSNTQHQDDCLRCVSAKDILPPTYPE